jgi:photosystem II stability/assembly factor-like uncharacterized protein
VEPARQSRLGAVAAASAVATAIVAGAAGGTGPAATCSEASLEGAEFGYALCAGRVLVTRDGDSWRDVTPRLPRLGEPPGLVPAVHDVVFVDGRRGWVAANECAAGKAFVFRTVDGGRRWRAVPVESTNCAAGSRLDLSFVDALHGWLVRIFLNGNSQYLSRTLDGGATWSRISSALPLVGTVTFRTSREGWLTRGDFRHWGGVLATQDGGRTWRRSVLVLPRRWAGARAHADAPRFFGRRGVLPVDLERRGRTAVAFYVTSDGGRRWRAAAVRSVSLRTTEPRSPFVRFVPVAVATPTSWWMATGNRTIAVTHDGGRRWSVRRIPAAPRAITAPDGRRAWVTPETGLLATDDGGRTWRRLAPR